MDCSWTAQEPERRRVDADRPDVTAFHPRMDGEPGRRLWEEDTAMVRQIPSTHHSWAGGESSQRQIAMQPDREVGPDGTDDLNGEQLKITGT